VKFCVIKALALLSIFVVGPPWVWAQSPLPRPFVQGQISRLVDTAHIEFRGMRTWVYDLKRPSPGQVLLTLPALDEATIQRLKEFNDPLLKSVEVRRDGPDHRHVVVFNLADESIESFDYLTDDPSRLILDFYRRPQAESAKAESVRPVAKPKAKKSSSISAANVVTEKKVPRRQPAGDEFLQDPEKDNVESSDIRRRSGLFDGGDQNFDRFRIKDYEIQEDAILAARHNVYLPFPMLKMPISQLDRILENAPELVIRPKDNRENKEARLLVTLFERKRWAVFLKTYDYFVKTYKNSDYLEILDNMAARVHLERWRETQNVKDYERAKEQYNQILARYKDSPLREYNHFLVGLLELERGEALATLQTFSSFTEAFPNSAEIPFVRKAMAEAYLQLRKWDEALAEYTRLQKDFPGSSHAREATYRMGDVAFAKGDLNQAIQVYERTLASLPKEASVYPNASYNMAEARFWAKEYRASLNNFVEFVKRFPDHPFGAYALTRVGELLGILGADPTRVMGAYLESYFRFADHPGAKVARLRMLAQQMRGMKDSELKKAMDEIENTGKNLDIPGMKEFTTLLVAEGLSSRGEYSKALGELISYYQKNPTTPNVATFRARILRNIANEMKSRLDKGDFLETLQFQSQYANTWLKNSDRIDIPYFLAGSFEKAGAYQDALNIYTSVLNKRRGIVGTQEEKERRVREHLPSMALRQRNSKSENRWKRSGT
jgi:tetratricopeptide (TPR) repeat protein